ncbi:4987_t:CDS:2 [Cetraspora pellucida]|uniref:4987_t:CDS:1 n=1 Tax=Cetraspora pellucida TaxID=1433469 RepID=A0A9N8W091_9GLOM|nr:4987_t:CDS:2 [Cetraspora pellucida]
MKLKDEGLGTKDFRAKALGTKGFGTKTLGTKGFGTKDLGANIREAEVLGTNGVTVFFLFGDINNDSKRRCSSTN